MKTIIKNTVIALFVSTIAISAQAQQAEQSSEENISENTQQAELAPEENVNAQIEEAPQEVVEEKPAAKVESSNIRSILNSSSELVIENYPIDKAQLRRVYETNNYAPLFFANGKELPAAVRAYELIGKAEENGQNKSEFDVDLIKRRVAADDANSSAKTDILTTQKILNLIKNIRYGRKIPKDIGFETYFRFMPKTLDVVSAFSQAIKTSDVDAFINSISPQHKEYADLKNALKNLLAEPDDGFKYIDMAGVEIKPNMSDYRIPLIRQRLKAKRPINPAESGNRNLYDSELQKSVRNFQKSFGVDNGAVIDKETIKRLNVGKKEKIAIVKMNMERWRWLPDNLGDDKYIIISLNDYKYKAYQNHELVEEMFAVVGRAQRRTPIMNSIVLNMTFQPFWYVPRKYALDLLVPQLQKNNRYLEKDDILVYRTVNGKQEQVDPTTVDWSKINPSNYNFAMRQNPGEHNALGQVKFELLNDKEIFMHGTSEPEVFSKDLRAISAGCVRVADPLKVSHFLVENNADREWAINKLEELYTAHKSGLSYEQRVKSVRIDLKNKIPLYMVYFTASVNDKGELVFQEDIYNIDEQMAAVFNK
jgi:murein L,D-transpeptidase YcbB/YkuD